MLHLRFEEKNSGGYAAKRESHDPPVLPFTARRDLRDRAETGNIALADHYQEDGVMEIRRFVPGEEAALSRLAARTLLEYNSKHTAPEEEPWIPLLVEKYRPEAILGFSETGHTYVLCDGEALLGMGGVRKTGEDECLIYGLFLTPEAIGKGYGTMLFHALEADELYTQCSRAWLIPTTAALGFYEKMGYTYMDGYRVRRKDDGLFYMEKHLK